ncbi:MAG: hypothetical protein KJO65_09975 [Gemmatimonadetes bacterium]|nr:hypothetical protein [Gemmatimonadota bacterium]
MRAYQRVARGAEAGAIAAATVEVSFFVLDAVRLQPMATPGVLSGASLGPGGGALDLGSLSGVLSSLWATYQVLTLTATHFVLFAAVGIAASLLFDWSKPGRLARFGFVALLCTAAFFATVAISGSSVALDEVGIGWIVAMNLLGAAALAAGLRLVSSQGSEKAN